MVGEMHPPGKTPDDVFKVAEAVAGETAAGTVADMGCKMVHPA